MDCKPLGFVMAALVAGGLTSGCGSPKPQAVASTAATPAAPAGPANAAVLAAGTPHGLMLDPTQRAELEALVANAPPKLRGRLRYALGTADDGKARLVVYDGEGLPADGHHAGRPHEYVVFRVINSKDDEHYDPQQNAIIPPIAPPKDRDSVLER
jgi:hypothetical protein